VADLPLAVREGRGWRFNFQDRRLTFVRIDHQTRLQFGQTEVVIETAFELIDAGRVVNLDPHDRAGLGPILSMYPDELAEATADENRVLQLTFVSGKQVTVPPNESYESWSLVGPGTSLVVCTPGVGGGDLAVWT